MKKNLKIKVICSVVIVFLSLFVFAVSAKTVSSSSSASSDISNFLSQNNTLAVADSSSTSSATDTTVRIISSADSSMGSITPSGDVMMKKGSSVTFKASANLGYVFSHFLVDGQETEPTSDTSYVMKDDGASHSIQAVFEETKNVKLHFINLGESSAVLIEDDGKFALIDTGMSTDMLGDQSGDVAKEDKGDNAGEESDNKGHEDELIAYLNSKNVTRLEFMILTNAQPEYMGGASYIIQTFDVGTVYMKRYSDSYVKDNNGGYNLLAYNKTLAAIAGKMGVEIIWTDSLNNDPITLSNSKIYLMNYKNYEAANADNSAVAENEGMRSLMALVSYNNRTGLITGGYKNNSNYGTDSENNGANGNVEAITSYLTGVMSHVDSDRKPDIYTLPSQGEDDDNDLVDYVMTQLKPVDIVQFGYFCRLSGDRLINIAKTGAKLYVMQNAKDSLEMSLSSTNQDPIENDIYIYYSTANSSWYAYKDKNILRDDFLDFYFKSESARYYFDSDGKAAKMSFFKKDSKSYYAGYYGVIYSGRHKIVNDEYYFNEQESETLTPGELLIGDIVLDSVSYYSDSRGVLQKGFVSKGNKRYYYQESSEELKGGELKYDWFKVNSSWYYADKTDGSLFSGTQDIDGKSYLFDAKTYVMLTGFQAIQGKRYYYNDNTESTDCGAKMVGQDINVKGSVYTLSAEDGELLSGWQDSEAGERYFSPYSGELKKGWILVSGSWYYTSEDAGIKQKSGKTLINGNYYYLDPEDGEMKTGWLLIDEVYYYFDSSGKMVTGWLSIGGKTYRLADDGAMLVGMQNIDGEQYYFDESGVMATGEQVIDGKNYKFSDKGVMVTNWDSDGYYGTDGQKKVNEWFSIGDSQYYADENGKVLTGLHLVGGVACLFDQKGVLIKQSKEVQSYLSSNVNAVLG